MDPGGWRTSQREADFVSYNRSEPKQHLGTRVAPEHFGPGGFIPHLNGQSLESGEQGKHHAIDFTGPAQMYHQVGGSPGLLRFPVGMILAVNRQRGGVIWCGGTDRDRLPQGQIGDRACLYRIVHST